MIGIRTQPRGEGLQGGRLGHASGGDVQPGGPPDRVLHRVEPAAGHQLRELLHIHPRRAQHHAGDGLRGHLLQAHDPLRLDELTVGEGPRDLEASAEDLHGDDAVGYRARQGRDGVGGIESDRVDDLVAPGRGGIHAQGDGAVGADHPPIGQPDTVRHGQGRLNAAPRRDDEPDAAGAQTGQGGHHPL